MQPALLPDDEVIVEPAEAETLQPGDWVLLRRSDAMILHRLLGFDRAGLLLTKGDSRLAPDPPWPRDALVGRAVSLLRQGQTLPVPSLSARERQRILFYRLLATVWIRLRRVKRAIFLFALAFPLFATVVGAAVRLVSFEATPEGEAIRVTWQTASETDLMGFHLERALQEGGDYQDISGFIPAKGGDVAGANYDYTDNDVEAGQTYYYRLRWVEGGGIFYSETVSASLPLPPTDTPTPTFTPSPTLTSSPTSTPTSTPTPSRTPTPTPSLTLTPTPTPTPSPSPLPTATPTPRTSPTASPTGTRPEPSPTFTATPEPSPTPTSAGGLTATTPPPAVSPTIDALATRTPTIQPTLTFTPMPTPTTATVLALPDAETAADAAAEESLAMAQRRRNWVLIGVGVAILGGLVVIALGLLILALYRWGYLRLGR
jgi:hypothetical protein